MLLSNTKQMPQSPNIILFLKKILKKNLLSGHLTLNILKDNLKKLITYFYFEMITSQIG